MPSIQDCGEPDKEGDPRTRWIEAVSDNLKINAKTRYQSNALDRTSRIRSIQLGHVTARNNGKAEESIDDKFTVIV